MKKLFIVFVTIVLTLASSSLFAQQDKDFSRFKGPIQNDNIKRVTDLITKGTNVNSVDNNGTTPLLLAIQLNRQGIAKILIDAGADIQAEDKYGNSCLHYAVQKSFTSEFILTLIDKGININTLNNEKLSPFHFSLKRCNDFSFILIAKGADYSTITGLGQNALHISASAGCDSIFDFLLGEIEQFDVPDNNGDTPFLLALKGNHIHIATSLLEKGANINVTDKTSHTPLYYSVLINNEEIFNSLVVKGADVNVQVGGEPLIFFAAGKENMNIIRALLVNGATIDPVEKLADYPYKLGLIYFAKADISADVEKLVTYQKSMNYFSAAKEDYNTELNKLRTKQAAVATGQVCLGVLGAMVGSYATPAYGSDAADTARKEYLKVKIARCDDNISKIQVAISSINQVK